MTRQQEIDDPNSCLNKGPDDESKFVIRDVDVTAPQVVREWARLRIRYEKNLPNDAQITESLNWADNAEQKLMARRLFK